MSARTYSEREARSYAYLAAIAGASRCLGGDVPSEGTIRVLTHDVDRLFEESPPVLAPVQQQRRETPHALWVSAAVVALLGLLLGTADSFLIGLIAGALIVAYGNGRRHGERRRP